MLRLDRATKIIGAPPRLFVVLRDSATHLNTDNSCQGFCPDKIYPACSDFGKDCVQRLDRAVYRLDLAGDSGLLRCQLIPPFSIDYHKLDLAGF